MNKIYPKIEYGLGICLFNQKGKRYINASSGSSSVSNIGYGRTDVADIICDQVGKITVLPTHAFSSELVESYLEKLVDSAPAGFKKDWTVIA
jgi:adenosylmethionine-8-amino-7-oxononanoate aminotransferase